MKVLLIIPAYNEEDSIRATMEKVQRDFSGHDYIIIDDGSIDSTAWICKEEGYHTLHHAVNLGLAGAFQTGMKYAYAHHFDAALQFDADGQHQPKYIQKMVETMEEGAYDIVIGSRFLEEKKERSLRMLGNTLLSKAIRLTTGKTLTDPTSGMRLYGKAVMKEFAEGINYGPESDTIAFLIRRGVRIKEIQVHMQERTAGTSYFTVTKAMFYMVRMLISILFIQGFRKRV